MAGKTVYWTDAVLNLLRATSVTAPATVYVGLLSAAPASDSAAGTELSGSGYARKSAAFSAPSTYSGNVRQVVNSAIISFGPASADWSAAVAWGLYDALTAGNMLYWDTLSPSKTVLNGDTGDVAAGAFSIRED